MNNYNDFMVPNNNGSPLQTDYHPYPNNNPLEHPFNGDLYMSPPPTMGQQVAPNRHMSMMQQQQQQQQQTPAHPHSQPPMHQVYIETISTCARLTLAMIHTGVPMMLSNVGSTPSTLLFLYHRSHLFLSFDRQEKARRMTLLASSTSRPRRKRERERGKIFTQTYRKSD